MHNVESELEKQLPIEQLTLLHKQSFTAFFATIAVLLYILYWIYDLVDSHYLTLWVGALVVLNVYLLIWMYSVHYATINTQKAKRFIIIYQIQAILHGSSWGLLPFLLAELTTPEMQFFAYIVLCGMAAGAIGTTAMIYRIYLSFMLPMMLPIILSQLFLSDVINVFSTNTLQFLIIFIVSILVLAQTYADNIKTSISLIIEKKKLLNDVTETYEKTKAASKAKSSFLANMSHELRTPLNAVIGYSEIIYENIKENDFKTIADDAEKITLAGKHLLSLINNVLDLTKIESGKMEVYIEDIDMNYLLADINATVDTLMTKNNNTLVIDAPEKIKHVRTDSTKLRQVLLNILGNSAKFTKNGEVNIKVTNSSGSVKLSISDTGIGMTDKQLHDIAIPFMQADISTTKKYGGTGLGMNLTKHLTELLKIDLQVKSIPDEGTYFDLIIPINYEHA